MAPSRALLRCMTSASAQLHTPSRLRSASRLLSTLVIRPQCSTRSHTPQSSQLQHTRSAVPCIRSYSQAAGAAPEPPDYLNEAELHIFNKIRGELDPVKLEV